MTPINAGLILTFVAVLGFSIASFSSFDGLVQRMYESHRTEWKAAGGPRGHVWQPTDPGLVGGVLARDRLAFRLVLATPAWVSEDAEALALYRRFRLLRIAAYGSFGVFVVLYLVRL
jgi:hypothetical protein